MLLQLTQNGCGDRVCLACCPPNIVAPTEGAADGAVLGANGVYRLTDATMQTFELGADAESDGVAAQNYTAHDIDVIHNGAIIDTLEPGQYAFYENIDGTYVPG